MRDLYPETDDEYQEILKWSLDAWLAGRNAREPHESRWDRYDKHWEAYIKRESGDWRSKVYMPEVFQQIETIKPRLITELPRFMVRPVGPEDVDGARQFERVMEWAQHSSKLHLELVKTFHPTLLYGTGIIKTYPDTKYAYGSEMVPEFREEVQLIEEPLFDPETQRPLLDPDGNPVINTREVPTKVLTGVYPQKKQYVSYDGPAAKAVNIKNIWVAPEAEDVQSARYLIHRSFRPLKDILRLVKNGIYRWPDEMSEADLFTAHDDPRIQQLEALDLSPGNDPTRKQIEILEIWTNDGPDSPGRVITLANRRAILRVQENPFWHGQKPFIRFVDYLKPHHFWGIGEVQAMEGIQDAINAITNQRIDAGRLLLNPMFAVNTSQLEDMRDLTIRPGGGIRVKGDGMRPSEVVERIDLGDINQSSFAEVQSLQQMAERTTAVSSYQQGVDAPMQAETATGAAIMSEAGSSRFALKAKLFEIDPLQDLALHYGMILQQFTSEERVMRIIGEEGMVAWETVTPESLQGRFDFTVESMNSQQSETVKRQQALDVFNQVVQAVTMQAIPPQIAQVALRDVFEALGAKKVLKAMDEAMQQPQLPQGPMDQMMPPEMGPMGG